jgi:hypothetical protein
MRRAAACHSTVLCISPLDTAELSQQPDDEAFSPLPSFIRYLSAIISKVC